MSLILKLLLGGSPCTWWSIGKAAERETEPFGTGWELFRNYLIAKEKYKPDYFLYENNQSMSKAIREKITEELRVEPIPINSALVSAQNRRRLYWTNIPGVGQPEDRGILLRDILEMETLYRNGTRCLTAAFAMRQVGRRINERGVIFFAEFFGWGIRAAFTLGYPTISEA